MGVMFLLYALSTTAAATLKYSDRSQYGVWEEGLLDEAGRNGKETPRMSQLPFMNPSPGLSSEKDPYSMFSNQTWRSWMSRRGWKTLQGRPDMWDMVPYSWYLPPHTLSSLLERKGRHDRIQKRARLKFMSRLGSGRKKGE